MRLFTIAAIFSSLFCFQSSSCDQANAQLFHKSSGDEVVNYQPSDPWKRSKWFNLQTGNTGLFYNCDCEQSKRNSPYICWKQDYEPMLPPRVGHWNIMRQQLDEVRQRVIDGSCACDDCRAAGHDGLQAGCSTCMQSSAIQTRNFNNASARSAIAGSTAGKQAIVDPLHGNKFGLVQGKIIEPRKIPQMEPNAFPSIQESSVAKKSLLDQLRVIKRR